MCGICRGARFVEVSAGLSARPIDALSVGVSTGLPVFLLKICSTLLKMCLREPKFKSNSSRVPQSGLQKDLRRVGRNFVLSRASQRPFPSDATQYGVRRLERFPVHRRRPGTPDTARSEVRSGRTDTSVTHERTLNRRLPSNGAVAGKGNRRSGNRVDRHANRQNGARTPRKSNHSSLRYLRRHSSALNKIPTYVFSDLQSAGAIHLSSLTMSNLSLLSNTKNEGKPPGWRHWWDRVATPSSSVPRRRTGRRL
jgi:hypothetical protein